MSENVGCDRIYRLRISGCASRLSPSCTSSESLLGILDAVFGFDLHAQLFAEFGSIVASVAAFTPIRLQSSTALSGNV